MHSRKTCRRTNSRNCDCLTCKAVVVFCGVERCALPVAVYVICFPKACVRGRIAQTDLRWLQTSVECDQFIVYLILQKPKC
jgi:hypothetical protein